MSKSSDEADSLSTIAVVLLDASRRGVAAAPDAASFDACVRDAGPRVQWHHVVWNDRRETGDPGESGESGEQRELISLTGCHHHHHLPGVMTRADVVKLVCRWGLTKRFSLLVLLDRTWPNAGELAVEMVQCWRHERFDLGVLESKNTRIPRDTPLMRLARHLVGHANFDPRHRLGALSASLLRRVPFETVSSTHRCELELMLQAAHVNARTVRFDVGEEACRDLHGRHALRSSLRYRLHQWGMCCSTKYRDLTPSRYRDKTRVSYSSHQMALAEVSRRRPRCVLDIGCGPGFVAQQCRAMGMEVTAIDQFEVSDAKLEPFFRCDLQKDELPVNPWDFDLILLLDVIEHLEDPEFFLSKMRHDDRPALRRAGGDAEGPVLVLTTPNVAFLPVRMNLLMGRFPYAERGILDITHKRLFTRSTLRTMLRDCGYEVLRMQPVPAPFEAVMPGAKGRTMGWLCHMMAKVWPGGMAFQWLVVCRPMPGMGAMSSGGGD
ncbi:MAG: class I SAM-dependent methyltransferase [Phycisphaeraceae bacterium]|nr:class I SAM-dependent methyltransferase [Phycisphaeraceae bacterium]